MSTPPKNYATPEEYLELERKAEGKSEYYQGQIFAMSGVSIRHDRIKGDLWLRLREHLRDGRCEVLSSDVRVLVEAKGLYTYPDLSVVCGRPAFADSEVDTLTNPTLLVEVLSPSTESYDRGTKAKLYRALPSLRELLLVAQSVCEVELYRRQPDGTWSLIEAKGIDGTIELQSIEYTLQLREIYERAIAGEAAGAA